MRRLLNNTFFGCGSTSAHLPRLLFPFRRPILVTDRQLGMDRIEAVKDHMPKSTILVDDIVSEPDTNMCDALRHRLQKEGADVVVAFGGGSPIDAAKVAVACNAALQVQSSKYVPLIAMPTTSGTGSEVTPFAVVTTSSKEKRLLRGPSLVPEFAIADAEHTMLKPPHLTAATGIDALCHAMEAYISLKHTDESDMYALRAMLRIGAHLEECVTQSNPTRMAREQMMRASTEAGLAFSLSSVTLIHGMSRPLGRFGIGHGLANAQLLSTVVKFSERSTPRIGRVQALIFPDSCPSESLSNLLDEYVHIRLGLPRLSEHLSSTLQTQTFEEAIPTMVEEALASGSPSNHPHPVHECEIKDLYHRVSNR